MTNNTTIPKKKFAENQRKKNLDVSSTGEKQLCFRITRNKHDHQRRERPSKENSDSKVVYLERLSVSHVARLLAGRWDDFSFDHFRR